MCRPVTIAAGRFEVTIGGETDTLRAGESFIVPPNAEHGVVALEAGTLIDSFAPARADFL
jgi:quercetin dioxygenase-like cupin family protein